MARWLRPSPEQLRVLKGLAPYVWPSDRPDLQRTVIVSLLLMLAAKLVTVAMPFTYKWATDALVAAAGGNVPASEALPWLLGAPAAAIILYGLTRITMTLLVQVREGMFAKVAMHAVRRLALTTFEHMHRLSLRFHLERKTGGLTRVLERGRLGIENITRMTLMTFVPTIVEFALVLAVCAWSFDWRYVLTVAGMIVTLPLVHGAGHRLAHPDPPRHERERHGGQHQGHRQPAQLRDGEILRRRAARGAALRPLDGRLRAGQHQELHLARRPQHRPGGDLHDRADAVHGDGRARRRRRHQDGRGFRAGQRPAAAAVHPAQLHGHGVSRDQAVDDRHRAHDGRAGAEARGRGPARRRAAGRQGRHHPLRERAASATTRSG